MPGPSLERTTALVVVVVLVAAQIEPPGAATVGRRVEDPGRGDDREPVDRSHREVRRGLRPARRAGLELEDAEVGQRTTSLCHLAHISIKLGGKKLNWNPQAERFDNDDANKLIAGPLPRAPWKLDV